MDGLTLVQLTDLHISRLFPEAWARAVVDRTNALAPDMILITGDLIDGTVDARKDDVEPLRDLHAPLGVLTITGNHEYYSGYGAWMDKYRELGLKLLSNDHVAVSRNGGTLYVAGITDAAAAGFADPLPDIHQALDGIPQGAPVILMAHRPGDAAAAADLGVGLQLSGHTHGGQIVGFHLLAKAANRGFVSGSYQVGKMMLYVSNGTGLWGGFPIRLGFPSEITYITLRAIGAAPHTS
jgi:predicted MPP superfamily phosphohydrolase